MNVWCNIFISLMTIMALIIWWLNLHLPNQSMPIITKVVDSIPHHRDVYNTVLYDQVCQLHALNLLFSLDIPGPSSKTDHYDITEILLTMAFNINNPIIHLKSLLNCCNFTMEKWCYLMFVRNWNKTMLIVGFVLLNVYLSVYIYNQCTNWWGQFHHH